VLTSDERFEGARAHHYGLWLRQRPGRLHGDPNEPTNDAANWIAASAAAAVGELMCVLTAAASVRWKVCAGYMGVNWNMYYRVSREGLPEPLRPADAAAEAVELQQAARWRKIVERHFFDVWVMAGAVASGKMWSPPFLEPVST